MLFFVIAIVQIFFFVIVFLCYCSSLKSFFFVCSKSFSIFYLLSYPNFTRMKTEYLYVVYRGTKPGIYATWEECKESIKGFEEPVYRKFSTIAEVKAFWFYGNTSSKYKSITPWVTCIYIFLIRLLCR